MKSLLLIPVLLCSISSLLTAQESDRTPRRDPQPPVRYPLGIDSLAQAGVPTGTLEGPFLFKSNIIQDTIRKYWVFVPAQYTAEKPACLLVFQDGARAINPDGVIRAPQVLANLIAKKQIPVTIGIFITPGQRGNDFPDSIGTGNPDNRDREYDVLTDDYARMVIEEILPEVEKKYKISKQPADRTIGGSSSGAICAFTVAWERPEEFRNVISMIGSFTNIHGGHVYPDLVREADKKPIRIFLQDGENDNRSPQNLDRDWFLQNQKMVAALKEKDYDMAHVFGIGPHADDHGGAILPQMLKWVWRDHPEVQPTQVDFVAEAAAVKPETSEVFPGFDPNISIDPSGTYTWENSFGNTQIANKLLITSKDGTLSGTYQSKRGDEEPVVTPIGDPTLTGNKLVFDITTTFRDREITSNYQGIVTEQGISGWRLMSFGGQNRDSQWRAEREGPESLLKTANAVDSWVFELHEDGQGTIAVEGDAIVFNTTKLSGENWHVQAYQKDLALKEGTEYELKFSGMSPTNSTILLTAQIHQEDWHNIGLQEQIDLGKTYREYKFIWKATDVVPENNRVGFVLGESTGAVHIKGLSLSEVK